MSEYTYNRAFKGAIYCGLSGIPLAFVITVLAAVFGEVDGPTGLILALSIYLIFSVGITFGAAFLIGFPIFVTFSKFGVARLRWMLLAGALGGALINLWWIGAPNIDDGHVGPWVFLLVFVVSGALAAAAFWYGAKHPDIYPSQKLTPHTKDVPKEKALAKRTFL